MELHWAVEALQDRDAIYDYIQADSPQAALTLDELFAKQAGRLVDYPHLWVVLAASKVRANCSRIGITYWSTSWQANRSGYCACCTRRGGGHRNS